MSLSGIHNHRPHQQSLAPNQTNLSKENTGFSGASFNAQSNGLNALSMPMMLQLVMQLVQQLLSQLQGMQQQLPDQQQAPANPHTNSNSQPMTCLLYTSPSPRDLSTSRMPSSA